MPNFRRNWVEGQIHFQTHVTYERMPILVDNIDILWEAIEKIKRETAFDLMAWVILPDHVHWLIDVWENHPSHLIRRIKLSFSSYYRKKYAMREGRIWQHRFWNHVITNQKDLNNHIDYIHYNPVKHGHTMDSFKYAHSSLHEYYSKGYYPRDWGVLGASDMKGNYGE